MVLIVALPGAFVVVCVGLFVDVCVFCSVVFSVDDVVSFLAVVFSVVVTSVAVVTSVVVTPVASVVAGFSGSFCCVFVQINHRCGCKTSSVSPVACCYKFYVLCFYRIL